jgi:hypothetical protein
MNSRYEKPTIITIPSNRILEMLGPVSCGSGIENSILPIGGGAPGGFLGGGGGYQGPR